ncbi:MAG: RNA methyltransferase, partial [Rickettsiales bacterium]|nr:RNA methyltransferase [Rickettsiales bacterium]
KTDYTYIKYTDIEANIIEGIEQSERLDFPITNKIDKLENIINSIDGTILFCEERTGINSLSALKDVTFRDKIYCLVGPEGGFSQNEKEILRKHDKVMSVNLGRLILRTETASISILSIARLLCGNVIDK